MPAPDAALRAAAAVIPSLARAVCTRAVSSLARAAVVMDLEPTGSETRAEGRPPPGRLCRARHARLPMPSLMS